MTHFELNKRSAGWDRLLSVASALTLILIPIAASAGIDGWNQAGNTTPSFNLTAREGYISIADGGSIYSWGYSPGTGQNEMQLPGPTLIVRQGSTVTVTLRNQLPAAAGNVSIVFPGHEVTATDGVTGELTQEAAAGQPVTYTFVAANAGTYQYHSGTRPDLQVEMGLYGALIVRPPAGEAGMYGCGGNVRAYEHPETCFDREHLFLLSEVDLDIHQAVEMQVSGPGPIDIGTGPFHPEYYLLNGRAAPDTMAAAGTAVMPTQPYNAFPRMHPGERLLLRVVGAGRDLHPYHTHGNHAQVLARDGRMLVSESDPLVLAGPELFTIPSTPGGTVDAIFEWTGKDLGWDVYGTIDINDHVCTPDADGYHSVEIDPNYREWCADHNKPIPVELPGLSSLAFGGFYGGSPYLGAMGSLPPGEGGLNPNAGFAYMWHSHNAIEQVNNDVFPGGMTTMLIVEPWGAEIP